MKIAFSLLTGRSTIHLDLTGSFQSSALNAPLVPRVTSLAAPSTRAVSGVPDCNVRFSVAVHSPTIDAKRPPFFSQWRSDPKGSSAVKSPEI